MLVFLGVFILCGLGTWQIQRLEWKTKLLAAMESENAKDAKNFKISMAAIPSNPDDAFFLRGTAQGVFDYENEILVGPKALDGIFVQDVITPLLLKDGGILLVQRGLVSDKAHPPPPSSRPDQTEWVTGALRKPHLTRFISANRPAENLWHQADIKQIAATKGLDHVAPVILYAEDGSYTKNAPWPKIRLNSMPRPPNNHFFYAIFWFTMATILVGFSIIVRRSDRKSANKASLPRHKHEF